MNVIIFLINNSGIKIFTQFVIAPVSPYRYKDFIGSGITIFVNELRINGCSGQKVCERIFSLIGTYYKKITVIFATTNFS